LEQSPQLPPLCTGAVEENRENFFSSFLEPQWGQALPFQLDERISNSLSCSHALQ
jgi:hypothetical protein